MLKLVARRDDYCVHVSSRSCILGDVDGSSMLLLRFPLVSCNRRIGFRMFVPLAVCCTLLIVTQLTFSGQQGFSSLHTQWRRLGASVLSTHFLKEDDLPCPTQVSVPVHT